MCCTAITTDPQHWSGFQFIDGSDVITKLAKHSLIVVATGWVYIHVIPNMLCPASSSCMPCSSEVIELNIVWLLAALNWLIVWWRFNLSDCGGLVLMYNRVVDVVQSASRPTLLICGLLLAALGGSPKWFVSECYC